jgi:predicted aldo/keto reductase-like oxidoreductase
VNALQTRRFGRTGLQVGVVGFGGTWISELPEDDAVKVVRHAYNCGINYFDTAKLDGDSEEKIGVALQDVRDRCVIATKVGSRTRKESLEDVECSLRRLRTDRIDLIQLHGIDDEKTLTKAMRTDGVLQTCKQARAKGMVDFIGITGHKPRVLKKAIETGEFDTVLVPLNVVTRQALEELVPLAKRHDIGVAVMKPLSAKTSNLITCLYQPSLSLLSDDVELKAFLGKDQNTMATSALRYVLSQDIAVTIPGMRSIKEVEVAAKAGSEFTSLTKEEATRFQVELGSEWCRDCGLCNSCPQNLNVAAILRFHSLHDTYGLKNWARKLYAGLEVAVEKCNCCLECEQKCPYQLPITSMLQKTRNNLSFESSSHSTYPHTPTKPNST